MRALKLAVALFVTQGNTCAAPPELHKQADEQSVSMIQLISRPELFDEKHVEVGGYLTLRTEYESSLFLDKDSLQSGMTANSIALDLSDSPLPIQDRAKQLDRTYVIVAGFFKAGPTAFSAGELYKIYYVAPAQTLSDDRTPAEP